MPRPFPFETFGSVWPAMGVGPGPKVPTMVIVAAVIGTPVFCNKILASLWNKSSVQETIYR